MHGGTHSDTDTDTHTHTHSDSDSDTDTDQALVTVALTEFLHHTKFLSHPDGHRLSAAHRGHWFAAQTDRQPHWWAAAAYLPGSDH